MSTRSNGPRCAPVPVEFVGRVEQVPGELTHPRGRHPVPVLDVNV